MAKQDALGTKSFKTKTDADNAYRQEQASKYSNTFTSEPKTRPDYIPSNITYHGSSYHVVYYGGHYGYYCGGSWTPLDLATYMVVTDAMLRNSGDYYDGDNYGTPPVSMTTTTTTTSDTDTNGRVVTTTTQTTAPTYASHPISAGKAIVIFLC